MKLRKITAFLFLSVALILTGCQKSNLKEADTDQISLIYESPGSSGIEWELIVQVPPEKILDTILPFNTRLDFQLPANVDAVDLTVIAHYQSDFYLVNTYKGVDPRTWQYVAFSKFMEFGLLNPNYTTKSVTYVNVPAALQSLIDPNNLYSNYLAYMAGTNYVDNALKFTPWQVAGNNYNYIMFPQKGLYKITPQVSGDEIIDLSKLDTANGITFNTAPGFHYDGAALFGVIDTTDYSKSINLYTSLVKSEGADLFYPDFQFQKYGLSIETSNFDSSEIRAMYVYTDSIPRTVKSFESGDYQIGFEYADVFEVNFPRKKPTYYNLNLRNDHIMWDLSIPPDSSVTYPIQNLTDMQSKLLATQQLDDLQLLEFSMFNFGDLNYRQATNFWAQPRKDKINQIRSMYMLTRRYK